jgi:hypothetical protein
MRRIGCLLALLLAVAGCGLTIGHRACPMYESVGGLTVDASSFVKVHKPAATLRVCLGSDAASCGSSGTAMRSGTVVTLGPDNHAMAFLSGVGPGRYWVRVVIADSAGTSLVDAATPVHVRHSDGISGCPNTATNSGSVTVEANGSLAAT